MTQSEKYKSETVLAIVYAILTFFVVFFVSLMLLSYSGVFSYLQVPTTVSKNQMIRQEQEQLLSRKIQNLLEKIIGNGKVKTQINLDIDFSKVTSSEELALDNSRMIRNTLQSGGVVKKISAVVLLDDDYQNQLSNQEIEQLIKTAIAFNAERGDVLDVVNVAFAKHPYFTNLVEIEVIEISTLALVIVLAIWLLVKNKTTSQKNNDGIVATKPLESNAKLMAEDNEDNIADVVQQCCQQNLWDKLADVDNVVLSRYLQNEDPQIVAIIISKLKAPQASDILARFPAVIAADVLARMVNSHPVNYEFLQVVENTVRQDLIENCFQDNYQKVLDIMAGFEQNTETHIISALENNHHNVAKQLHSDMLNFENLIVLQDEDIVLLLHYIKKEELLLALKGASEKIKNIFFVNMPPKTEKMIRVDIEKLGPVKLKEIQKAQWNIVDQVKTLAKEGKINLHQGEY